MDLPINNSSGAAERIDHAPRPQSSEECRAAFRASLRLARYCKELGMPETRRFFHNTALLAFQTLKPCRLSMRRFR